MTERTHTALADAVTADLDDSYDLVYVDYRDQLTDKQVDALVRGDWETVFDLTAEFESDGRTQGVDSVIEQAVADKIREWENADDADYSELADTFTGTDAYWTVRDAIEERDNGDWLKQLAGQTPAVLLRIPIDALDEDHSYFHESVSPAQVLTRLGVEATQANLATVGYALDNADPEFSLLMGYWIVGAEISELYDLPNDEDPGTIIEISNPHLYLGNPFAGSGFITEEPLTTTVRVRRDRLRTDKDAFGYAVDEVYGGLNPSSFAATIRAVAPTGTEERTAA